MENRDAEEKPMTSRERFLTAINGGQPDRVPMFDFLFQEPLYESLIGHRPGSFNGLDALALARKLGQDAIWVPLAGFQGYSPEWIDERTYRDEWGTVFVRSDVSWPIDSPIRYPITSRADFEGYVCPNPLLPGRDLDLRATIEANRDSKLAITCGVQGPLTTAWLLMGFENISYSLYDDPDLLESVFAMSNDFFKKAAKVAVECGIDGVWVSEDLGDSNSVFFRKDLFVKHFYPYFKDLVDYVDSLGVPALLHSCGNINAFVPELVEIGLDALNPLEVKAGMDPLQMKRDYGDKLVLHGGLNAMYWDDIEKVEAEMHRLIPTLKANGGYILSSDHSVPDSVSFENFGRIIELAKRLGSYE